MSINKAIGGGGGSSSSPLKQLLIASDSNTVKDGEYTITYSADSVYNSYIHGYCYPYKAVEVDINNPKRYWSSSKTTNNYWEVDLGRIVDTVTKFCFRTTGGFYSYSDSSEYINPSIKNYELSYRKDIKDSYKTIVSAQYYSGGITNSIFNHLVTHEFNPISLRYFRVTILDRYPKSDYASLASCQLYALNNKQFFIKESDNNIYDNILSEKIITLDTWNALSKKEKLNLLETSYKPEVLDIVKLKSFGSYKVISSEDL